MNFHYKNSIKAQKFRDFFNEVNKLKKEIKESGGNLPDLQTLYAMASMRPAPRFYVDYEFAYREILHIRKNGKPSVKSKYSMKMYLDIYSLYCKKSGNRKSSTICCSILLDVINSTAPQYYFNPDTITRTINIIYRNRNK